MPWFVPHIRDHRRQPTTLVRPDRLGRPAPGQQALTAEQRDEILAHLKLDVPGPRFWIRAGVLFAIWISLLVGAVLAARLLSLPGWVSGVFIGSAPLGVPFIFAYAGHWYLSTVRHRQTINALIRSGLCASCAYRIDNLTPRQDGCVVCPECGAAWRPAPTPDP